jgi:hypothetical protein
MIGPGGREYLGDGLVNLGKCDALGVGQFRHCRCVGGERDVNTGRDHPPHVEWQQTASTADRFGACRRRA